MVAVKIGRGVRVGGNSSRMWINSSKTKRVFIKESSPPPPRSTPRCDTMLTIEELDLFLEVIYFPIHFFNAIF